MHNYKCKKCDKFHKLVTLLEFPQPDVISNITSGRLKQELYFLNKSFFMVDRRKAIVQCELSINILDYDDELDMLVWAIIEKEEYLTKVQNLKAIDKLYLNGRLFYEIPFYENTMELPVLIEIDLEGSTSDKPKIVRVEGSGGFQKKFKEGFEMHEFEEFLSKFYHPEN